MPAARLATVSDLPAIGTTLAAAFADDPVWRFLVPDRRRWRAAPSLFRAEAARHLGTGRVQLSADGAAVAVWARPDPPRNSAWSLLRMGPGAVRLFGRGLGTAAVVDAGLKRHHPGAPHWYLAVLGTRPDRQGRGMGGAALAPVLGQCDTDGVPAYLESSAEANLAFYARHGFEAGDPVVPTRGCPPVWPMWREPR